MNPMNEKVTCNVCGYKTLDARCDWDICPICGWEDDVLVTKEDLKSPANRGTRVSQAQANFMMFGASLRSRTALVRSPDESDERDKKWMPMDEALQILKESDQASKLRHDTPPNDVT